MKKSLVLRPPRHSAVSDPYWTRFRCPTVAREPGPVLHLGFAGESPSLLVAVTASRLCTVAPGSPHTRNLAPAPTGGDFCTATLRNDGRMILAGDSLGKVSVLDASRPRCPLRSLVGHTGPVHFTGFLDTLAVSAADDGDIRVWDIQTGQCTLVLSGHSDYIRAGCVSADDPNILLTGSYDHSVKLWDIRCKKYVLTVDHESPVTSVLFFPTSRAFVTSGGPYFKVFDSSSNQGQAMHCASNHQKIITSMALGQCGSRLLTGSMDHMVKIYDLADYHVVHSIKYASPVLSLALAPDDRFMAVGMLDGTMALRRRGGPEQSDDNTSDASLSGRDIVETYRTGSYRYFMRGMGYQSSPTDVRVKREKRIPLTSYDYYLRKFQYANALDVLFQMTPTPRPVVVVSMLDELIDRGVLVRALQARTESSLLPLLRFIGEYLAHPYYAQTMVKVMQSILDMYESLVPRSETLKDLVQRMQHKLRNEDILAKKMARIIGSLDIIFANCTKTSCHAENKAAAAVKLEISKDFTTELSNNNNVIIT